MTSGKKAWLVGMMGSGKSSVGRALADVCGVAFFDTDDLVEEALGVSIAEFWAEHGEEAFRDAEQAVVEKLGGAAAVVSAGGGAVLRAGNVEAMRRSGVIIWLTAEPEELAKRIGSGKARPLLRLSSRERTLAVLADERRHAYSAAADHTVATDGKAIDEVAEEVMRLWNPS